MIRQLNGVRDAKELARELHSSKSKPLLTKDWEDWAAKKIYEYFYGS